ncbi:transposable element Tcb1 transposase [Trichonephila clavipes]|nr:transposable element Tcb1 transposase [Trichonephila clavipes]
MVRAGISLGYRTDLHILKQGYVTAVRYRGEVLKPIVRLYAAAVGPTFVLMDDNARPHRADIVDEYLESEGIERMAWPAYSLCLNPIENLWDALGRAVSSRFPPPATLIELETVLQEEWLLLNSAVFDHLIESMNNILKMKSMKKTGTKNKQPGSKTSKSDDKHPKSKSETETVSKDLTELEKEMFSIKITDLEARLNRERMKTITGLNRRTCDMSVTYPMNLEKDTK